VGLRSQQTYHEALCVVRKIEISDYYNRLPLLLSNVMKKDQKWRVASREKSQVKATRGFDLRVPCSVLSEVPAQGVRGTPGTEVGKSQLLGHF